MLEIRTLAHVPSGQTSFRQGSDNYFDQLDISALTNALTSKQNFELRKKKNWW